MGSGRLGIVSENAHTSSSFDGPTTAAVATAFASVVALDPGGWFPFSIAKWPAVLVCALVGGASLAWNGRVAVARRSALLWLVLITTVALSAITGLDGRMAWFGTPVRHLGALTWMVFALLFVVGNHVGLADASFRRFMRGVVAAGGALAVYAIWELVIGAPVEYVSNSSRLGGPYGSPAYLGAASCLFLPIAIGLAVSAAEARAWRVGAAAVSMLLIVAALGSGTRGSLIALFCAGVIVAALRAQPAVRDGGVGRNLPALVTAVGVAAVAAFVALTTEQFQRSAPVGSRLDEWRLGVTAFADRPVLGFGPEGYRLVVDRYLSADYVRSYGDAVLPDRAHNAVLDVALSSGIIAALAYVALLVVVILAGFRLIRWGAAPHVGVGAASIAFITQQQFLFPVAEIDAVFWTVAGTAVALSTVVGPKAQDPRPGGTSKQMRAVRRLVAAGLVVLAAVSTMSAVRSVAADRLIRTSTRSVDVEQSISAAERAADLDPRDLRPLIVLARSLERRQTLNGVDEAIEAVVTARSISPLDPTVRRERARLSSLRASITGTEADRDQAARLWRELVDDAPNCRSCQRSLGLTLLEAGDVDGAIEALDAAVDLGDDVSAAVLQDLASM